LILASRTYAQRAKASHSLQAWPVRSCSLLKTRLHTLTLRSEEQHHFPLPDDMPKPVDDGAADHLRNTTFPPISLPATQGEPVDLSTLPGLSIVFCYPRSAAPGESVPQEWNEIPGARGCTPQACSFRDASDAFSAHGVARVFGLSTQSTAYQRELKERVHLPYQLLSDEELRLVAAARLPTIEWQGRTLTKRLTVAVEDGRIVKVWYPVFPPDKNAGEVLEWLKARG
jgi:peroxiredoxin